jgi:hypothetical protein
VRHGLDLADAENLPSWVESTRAGYRLYKKFGYQDVEVRETDFSRFSDKQHVGRHVGMLRPAKSEREQMEVGN